MFKKNKLAAKFSDSREFWRDIKTINSTNNMLPTVVDRKKVFLKLHTFFGINMYHYTQEYLLVLLSQIVLMQKLMK